jgi:hypothetical protein
MFHAYVQRFDVTGTAQNILGLFAYLNQASRAGESKLARFAATRQRSAGPTVGPGLPSWAGPPRWESGVQRLGRLAAAPCPWIDRPRPGSGSCRCRRPDGDAASPPLFCRLPTSVKQ